MCYPTNPPENARVQLTQCVHGTYHLSIGAVTLHLTRLELCMLAQALVRWTQSHPEQVDEAFLELTSLMESP